MTDKTTGPIPSETIGTDAVYSIEELSKACGVETAWVVELVEHGIIEPQGRVISEWRFSTLSIVRIAKAKRFDRDLGINPAGIALALDLLGEIDRLKARLNVLKWPRIPNAGHPDESRDVS
jgi:chaperone modulatory protein CbpM